MPQSDTAAHRVLVLAPTGRDAALISEMLKNGRLACEICRTVDDLARGIESGAGLALVAEEALIGVSLEPLLRALSSQPAWSDFPLVFLTTTGTRASDISTLLLKLLGDDTNVTILERPIRLATLLSSVRSGLRARRRQYQVRDYLAERKRHEVELLETQKLESLGVLAGGVAHDFNNLLTGIMGNASLALESLPPGLSDVSSLLTDVVNASERAAHLTKQLLAYAGKGKFVIEPVDLSAMVRAVTHLIQAAISKNAILRLNLASDLPAVEGDAAQIQQVIMNLVINAAEAIPENRTGDVVLTTSLKRVNPKSVNNDDLSPNFGSGELTEGTYIALEVWDNGAGMNESTLARIFDPFFTTKFTGRGLGLAAVQGIVRGHKGLLKVESRLDAGTTFRILFPALETAERPNVPEKVFREVAVSGNGATVLIIDDEEVVRKAARASLRRHGFDSLLAADGLEGIRVFKDRSHSITGVLLDLTMPGMGGEEVFRHLKTIRPDVKVIISSGFNEAEVVQRFTGTDLAGFIQKPYTSAHLAAMLKGVLGDDSATNANGQ
ncbi:hybrid sensor histidine kinase/response regulator [Nevskia soli]|jgi:signal transduction histidine kinase/ActR/RegA family two-component response regulator|uniref:hybrid sensor histidine kinase/response regulator n=1 Tax=Nevskia soli TaxID=418856 RepID=UPI0015D6B718|nr:ATP-binding protein [Nevskia soli]